MKKITTFLGCVGVVCLISGCTEADDLEKIVAPDQLVAEVQVPVSSESTATLSSETAPVSTSSSSLAPGLPAPLSSSATPDTVHTQVVITSSTDSYPDPYFSSGVFCWSKECEEKWAGVSSSSAPKSSSSFSIEIGTSSETPVEPTISGNTMIDNRDNQTYKLVTIGGVRWMDSNLKYRPSKGVYCEYDGEDVCALYGGFYSYGVAQAICPSGWRLPTQEEVEAADAAKPHEWWTVGGRFKLDDSGAVSEYGLAKEQGYVWIVQSGNYTSWRIKDYSGDTEHTFQSSEGARAYNVRCVEGTI